MSDCRGGLFRVVHTSLFQSLICRRTIYPPLRYQSYNLSAPRLPPGLAFSSYLRPVRDDPFGNNQPYQLNLGNATYPGLSCPYLHLASDPDEPGLLLNWYLDPEYSLFEGCKCVQVTVSPLRFTFVHHALMIGTTVQLRTSVSGHGPREFLPCAADTLRDPH